jgi:hypothetical protein
MREESLITRILKRKDLILLGGVAILCLMLFKQCNNASNLKKQLEIQDMNLDALNDTVRLQKNKAGEDTYVRKTLLATKDNLEKLNKDLADELKKVKGQVLVLQNVETVIKTDTQYVNNYLTVYEDGSYSLDWKFDSTFTENNYRKFSGNSFFKIDAITHKVTPGSTRINQDELGFSFITGIREKDKALEIFVTPKYPGMKITEIEGAIIDPHKSDVLKSMFPDKKFSVGPYVGVGIGSGYGLNGSPITGAMFNIGFSLQYSLFKF